MEWCGGSGRRSGLQAAGGAGAFGAGDVGAEGVERVVGDEAAPDEAPEGLDGFAGIASACGLMQRIEEAGAGGFENGEEFFFALGERFDDGALLREEGQLVGEEEGDAAVALADGLDAGPGNFAGGDERVEAGGRVVGDAGGEDGRTRRATRAAARPAGFRWRRAARRDWRGRCGAARAGPASG